MQYLLMSPQVYAGPRQYFHTHPIELHFPLAQFAPSRKEVLNRSSRPAFNQVKVPPQTLLSWVGRGINGAAGISSKTVWGAAELAHKTET